LRGCRGLTGGSREKAFLVRFFKKELLPYERGPAGLLLLAKRSAVSP
jgi:hypothetical protein